MIVEEYFGMKVGDTVKIGIGPWKGTRAKISEIRAEEGARNGWFTVEPEAKPGSSFLFAGEELEKHERSLQEAVAGTQQVDTGGSKPAHDFDEDSEVFARKQFALGEGWRIIAILKYENTRLQAQIAVIRDCLCDAHDHLLMFSPAPKSDGLIMHIRKIVDNPSAPSQLLERVKRLEAVADAATMADCHHASPMHYACPLGKALTALAALSTADAEREGGA